jgi:hypothetical protein
MGSLMSSSINASTASGGGVITTADASGILQLQTAGVTGLTIDASQKVTFANSLTSPTLVTPTIDSASVPTISGTAPLYMCRAWVNFNGTGTVAINASGNVSSITDNGVGDYTVNFTTAMPDANYSIDINGYQNTAGGTCLCQAHGATYTGSAVRVNTTNSVFVKADMQSVSVSIFR